MGEEDNDDVALEPGIALGSADDVYATLLEVGVELADEFATFYLGGSRPFHAKKICEALKFRTDLCSLTVLKALS